MDRVNIFHNTDKQNVDILFNNIQKCRVDLKKLLNNNVQNKIKDNDLLCFGYYKYYLNNQEAMILKNDFHRS